MLDGYMMDIVVHRPFMPNYIIQVRGMPTTIARKGLHNEYNGNILVTVTESQLMMIFTATWL